MRTVDSTVDVRVPASPAVDNISRKVFCDQLPYRASSDAVFSDINEYLQGNYL